MLENLNLETYDYALLMEEARIKVVREWLNEEYQNQDRARLLSRLAHTWHNTIADTRIAFAVIVLSSGEAVARKIALVALKRREMGTNNGYSIMAALVSVHRDMVRWCVQCHKTRVFEYTPGPAVCQECIDYFRDHNSF